MDSTQHSQTPAEEARFRVAGAQKAAAPLLRDFAVFHAADVSGIADRAAFLQALADAAEGDASSDVQLRAQLLLAFEKTLGKQDGAFRSKKTASIGVGALVLPRRPLELPSKATP